MRLIPFSVRSLVLTGIATAAIAVAACSDSSGPTPLEVTKMRLHLGLHRVAYTFRPGETNVAMLTAAGRSSHVANPPGPGADTLMMVRWLREDDTIDRDVSPVKFYTAEAAYDTADAGARGFYIVRRPQDGFGFYVVAEVPLPEEGIPVDFYLVDPDKVRIFGPVNVIFKTPPPP